VRSGPSGVPPPWEKLQRTSSTIVLPLTFGIWFGVFPFGTERKKVKGKGQGTSHSAAYEIRTAALYNLGSGS